jgi:uncharacterized membrane protein
MLRAVYEFWVFMHILGVAGFLSTHGVSMYTMFAVRGGDRDRGHILGLCELSKRTIGPMYISMGLLMLGGVAAGIQNSLFAQTWLWASIVVLLVILAAMSVTGTPWMKKLREGCTRWHDGTYPMTDEELAAHLDGPMVQIVAGSGAVALVLILYLMVYKPGA